MRRALLAAALALPLLAGCQSPEATRQRAGGSGADVGNRGEVELHAGSQPYYRTPLAMPSIAAGGGGEVAASPRGR
jgi:hypothetical protein